MSTSFGPGVIASITDTSHQQQMSYTGEPLTVSEMQAQVQMATSPHHQSSRPGSRLQSPTTAPPSRGKFNSRSSTFLNGAPPPASEFSPVMPFQQPNISPTSAGGSRTPTSAGASASTPTPSALSGATRVAPFPESSDLGLVVPPRLVYWIRWLIAYMIPLFFWLAANGFGFARDLVFFTPDVVDVSDAWPIGGWALNWISLVMQVGLMVVIYRHRSPFSPIVALGSQFQLTIAALAAVCHSNALSSHQVLTPIHDDKAVLVQLEWLAVLIQLIVFIVLLYCTPRRVSLPIMAQLSTHSKVEMMNVMRHLQGELSALTQLMERQRWNEQVAIQITPNGGAGATAFNPQAGTVSYNKNALQDILRTTRGANTTSRENGTPSGSAGLEDDGQQRGGGSRRNLNRAATIAQAAQTLLAVTDSRAMRKGGVTQGDRDMQKVASAVRSAHTAAQEAAMNGLPETPVQFLSVDYSNGGGNPTSGTKSHRRKKSKGSSVDLTGTATTRTHRKTKSHHRGTSSVRNVGGGSGSGVGLVQGQSNSEVDFFGQAARVMREQEEEARMLAP